MRITALVENTTAHAGVDAEHGLSLYIETAVKRILFDMGQGDLFAGNATAMGIDLAAVDVAVLSHGHYDHGGGLAKFLEINATAPVYLSRYAFEKHRNRAGKDIGLSPALSGSERLIFTDKTCQIAPGLTLVNGNERACKAPVDSGGMTAEGVAEDFRHEQYLLIEEDDKRMLISGCSHKGIENIMAWFHPHVLVGGFHLSSLPCDRRLTALARVLSTYDTDYITCHCTGAAQYEWMKHSLPRLRYLAAGEQAEI